jgi:hypothetical protein
MSSYVTKILSDFSVSNKKSWYVLDSTLGQAATFKLPNHDSDYDLANQFNTFFLSKVDSLVSSFSPPVLNSYASSASTNLFTEFDCVTERGILSILNESRHSSSCNVPKMKSFVRDLGVMIDSNLTMSLNVNHVCRKSFIQFNLISRH